MAGKEHADVNMIGFQMVFKDIQSGCCMVLLDVRPAVSTTVLAAGILRSPILAAAISWLQTTCPGG